MKYFWVVLEGMADLPVEALDGKTPLEVAETPAMDALAAKAELGMVHWVPDALDVRLEVSAYSMLGMNPLDSFTGLAPLEAASRGLKMSDGTVVFRCDFVTTADGKLVDYYAGNMRAAEAQVLLKVIRQALPNDKCRIESMGDFRNLLFVEDAALADELDDLTCARPATILGEKIAKHEPKGKAAKWAMDWMKKTEALLKDHEINRVRIDLGENPASMMWLWGQGRAPKTRSFEEMAGMKGAYWAAEESWRGLASLCGLKMMKSFDAEHLTDFNWIQVGMNGVTRRDYKTKIRRIEEFDRTVISRIVEFAGREKNGVKVLVTSDRLDSSVQDKAKHGGVPYLISTGAGPAQTPFHEKSAAATGKMFERGFTLFDHFLKGSGELR